MGGNVSLINGHVDKQMTNYERIKNMSVEEMAIILERNVDCEKFCAFTKDGKCDCAGGLDKCVIGVKQWLETEVEE